MWMWLCTRYTSLNWRQSYEHGNQEDEEHGSDLRTHDYFLGSLISKMLYSSWVLIVEGDYIDEAQ